MKKKKYLLPTMPGLKPAARFSQVPVTFPAWKVVLCLPCLHLRNNFEMIRSLRPSDGLLKWHNKTVSYLKICLPTRKVSGPFEERASGIHWFVGPTCTYSKQGLWLAGKTRGTGDITMPLSLKTIGSAGYKDHGNRRFGWVQVNRICSQMPYALGHRPVRHLNGRYIFRPPLCKPQRHSPP